MRNLKKLFVTKLFRLNCGKKTHKLKLSEKIKISCFCKTQKLNDNKIKNLNCKNTKKLELGQSSTRS